MKNQKIIIISLAIVIIGAAFYYVVSKQSEQSAFSTKTLTDGTVTYKVTPKNLTSSAPTWDFDISLDTHTGSLDQDLVNLVRLVDDKGNEYQATKWEGDPPGGHHREGLLKFFPVILRPAIIEIDIQTTTNPETNRLRWEI